MPRLRASVLALCLNGAMTACSPTPSWRPVGGALAEPGSYSFVLCNSQCSMTDTTLQIARGVLAVAEMPFADSGGIVYPDSALTACFVFTYRRRDAGTYAGVITQGLTTSHRSGDTTFVVLYESPDAFANATVWQKGDSLLGVVTSWGAGVAETKHPPVALMGLRLGSPELWRCTNGGHGPT